MICNDTEKVFKTLNPLFPPGWLQKEMKNSTRASLKLKKRWFLLTHNSLDYYKSSERNALKLGTLVLNSLCSVVQPDEKVFKETGEKNKQHRLHIILLLCPQVCSFSFSVWFNIFLFPTGYWSVIVYGRKHSYRLYCKLLNEATRWANAIQNVIDTKAPIDTPTQQLIQDIKVKRRDAPEAKRVLDDPKCRERSLKAAGVSLFYSTTSYQI